MPPLKLRWLFTSTVVMLVAWRPESAATARLGHSHQYDDQSHEQQPLSSPPVTVPNDHVPGIYSDDTIVADMPAADDDTLFASLRADKTDDEDTESPDIVRDNLTSLIRESSAASANVEDRDRQFRIKSIENQMLTLLGWTTRVPATSSTTKTHSNVTVLIPFVQQADTLRDLYDNVNVYPAALPSDAFTEKTQSFYPVCEMPKGLNEEEWNSKNSMNLMFNISFTRASNGISVNVSVAKLRLFKQYVPCYSQTSNETSSEESIKRPTNTNFPPVSSTENLSSSSPTDDKQIRVSIYNRPLKKKKVVKRKLLDSRMLPYFGEKWTEWNIHRAVKNWRGPFRNFALSIEVEDEYGNILPVNRFFKPMNCTGDAQLTTPKPIPGFLMEAVHYELPVNGDDATGNMSAEQALSLNMYRYPIADLTTVESADSDDAAYGQAKSAFVQSLADGVQQQQQQQTSGEHHRHRIRHSGGVNRHQINSSDVDSAVARLHRQQQQTAAASRKTGAAVDDSAGDNASLAVASTEMPD